MSWWMVTIITTALILASAFFVIVEFALLAARRHRLEQEADRSASARAALRGMNELTVMLAFAQLGITACTFLLGAITKPAIDYALAPVLEQWGLPDVLSGVIAFMLALIVVTFLHLVIGEMAPKSWAIAHPETAAKATGIAARAFTWPLRRDTRCAVLRTHRAGDRARHAHRGRYRANRPGADIRPCHGDCGRHPRGRGLVGSPPHSRGVGRELAGRSRSRHPGCRSHDPRGRHRSRCARHRAGCIRLRHARADAAWACAARDRRRWRSSARHCHHGRSATRGSAGTDRTVRFVMTVPDICGRLARARLDESCSEFGEAGRSRCSTDTTAKRASRCGSRRHDGARASGL